MEYHPKHPRMLEFCLDAYGIDHQVFDLLPAHQETDNAVRSDPSMHRLEKVIDIQYAMQYRYRLILVFDDPDQVGFGDQEQVFGCIMVFFAIKRKKIRIAVKSIVEYFPDLFQFRAVMPEVKRPGSISWFMVPFKE
jgi:hypothetical protein